MHIITHLLVGIVFALILGLNLPFVVIFILASVLIDLDHITDMGLPKKRKLKSADLWNPKRYREYNYQSGQKSMHLFHTFEFLTLIFILGLYFQTIFVIAVSFSVHILTDAIGNIWNRNINKVGGEDWIKYWFIIYYLNKRTIYNKENF
ncbi:MAG: hypothetical protein Q7S56_03110 [Nanoarchaeota archaeon]|nr:hypothetical protein [Nanoarchaeota archaeon]